MERTSISIPIESLSAFVSLTNSEKNVLLIAMSFAKHNRETIDFSAQVNEKILKLTGMNDVTRRAAISSLTKKGFLYRLKRSSYIICKVEGDDVAVEPKKRNRNNDN